MYRADEEGRKVNKAQMYRDLEAKFGRRDKAFERRMMNISDVVKDLGGQYVRGLVPAANIGANTRPILEELVKEAGFIGKSKAVQAPTTEASDPVAMDERVGSLINEWEQSDAKILPPNGLKTPTKREGTSTTFNRCPEVKAWVIRESGYNCEYCAKTAPFKKADGTPYLEVHHVVTLAEKGPDTISNTVALCPDCHRALHYSAERDVLVTAQSSALSAPEANTAALIVCGSNDRFTTQKRTRFGCNFDPNNARFVPILLKEFF